MFDSNILSGLLASTITIGNKKRSLVNKLESKVPKYLVIDIRLGHQKQTCLMDQKFEKI